jgi:hypothetical protein
MHYLLGVFSRYRAAPSVEKEREHPRYQTDSSDDAPEISA